MTATKAKSPIGKMFLLFIGGLALFLIFLIAISPGPKNADTSPRGDLSNSIDSKSESISDSAEAESKKSYEEDRLRFQKRFPSLLQPMPNLRWSPRSIEAADGPEIEFSDLVTPFGACASLSGSENTGFSVVSMDGVNAPTVEGRAAKPSKILGNFPSRSAAVDVAQRYCRQKFLEKISEPDTPGKEQPIWFKPDPEPSQLSNPAEQSSLADPLANATDAPGTPAEGSPVQPAQGAAGNSGQIEDDTPLVHWTMGTNGQAAVATTPHEPTCAMLLRAGPVIQLETAGAGDSLTADAILILQNGKEERVQVAQSLRAAYMSFPGSESITITVTDAKTALHIANEFCQARAEAWQEQQAAGIRPR